MTSNELYKIDDISITKIVLRIVLLIAIILMAINFEINKVAFSIFITLALALFYQLSANLYLIIYDDHFTIESSRFFKLINSKTELYFVDMESIVFVKGYFNYLNLIKYVPGTNKNDEMRIKIKASEEYISIPKFGTRNETLKAIELITLQIKNKQKKSVSSNN